ncbi:MAG: cytochrome c oxidase subunit II [Janthinobacterium lividum]
MTSPAASDAVTAGPLNAPLEYLTHAAGPASLPTLHLAWGLIAVSLLVCLIIAGLLLGALFRRRGPPGAGELSRADGMRWIYIGAGISTVALFGIGIASLLTLNAVSRPPSPPALTIQVTAYDWWWRVDYLTASGARDFVSANEIHIPAGAPVDVELLSADVIHAFWVPALAGKTETIPGQRNHQWLLADHPGIYRGQCTQYCGVQHAHMGFEVVADAPADYQRWLSAQRAPASSPATPEATIGQHLLLQRCAGCHTVRGTEALGVAGPDLTHIASRRLLAAGLLSNTPEHLSDWVQHAQTLKPASLMPDIALSPQEAHALLTYLETLQ